MVAVSIDEASAKHDPEDMALPIWSGTVPTRLVFGAPIPDTNGAMASGTIEVPTSVQRLLNE